MKTILGADIPETTRGILYLCHFNGEAITVIDEMLFNSSFLALEAYANIPNPESQLVTAETYDKLCQRLEKLHTNMKDTSWLNKLKEYL